MEYSKRLVPFEDMQAWDDYLSFFKWAFELVKDDTDGTDSVIFDKTGT